MKKSFLFKSFMSFLLSFALVCQCFAEVQTLPKQIASDENERTYTLTQDEIYEENEIEEGLDFSPLGVMTTEELSVNGQGNKLTLNGAGLESVDSGNAGSAYGVAVENGSELTFKDIEITGTLTGGNFSSGSSGKGITIKDSNSELRAGDSYFTNVADGKILIASTTISTVTITGGNISAEGTGLYAVNIYNNSDENILRSGD